MGRAEDIVEGYLLAQCKKFQIMCLKLASPGNNGVPDRLLIGHGQVVFVETKGVERQPRRLQREVIAEMTRNGADVRVAHSRADVDEIVVSIIKNKKASGPRDSQE